MSRRDPNRRVLHASCSCPGAGREFTNLSVTKRGGDIEFDTYVMGQCVVTLGEEAATELYNALGVWLG